MPKPEPSAWGRWQWPDGLGRWHAIAGVSDGVYMLACGRMRHAPEVTAGRPGPEKCCKTCAHLDDMRSAYRPEMAGEPIVVAVGPLVAAGA